MKKVIFVMFTICFFSCSKETNNYDNSSNNNNDVAVTSNVSKLGFSYAIINGFVNLDQITSTYSNLIIGIEVSLEEDFKTILTKEAKELEEKKISLIFYNLNANTKYYYRTFVKVNNLNYKGEKHSFTTFDLPEISPIFNIKEVSCSSAIIDFDDGDFNQIDKNENFSLGFVYSTSKNSLYQKNGYESHFYNIKDEVKIVEIKQLLSDKTYYICPYICVGNSYKYGEIKSFQTLSALLGDGTISYPYSVAAVIDYTDKMQVGTASDKDIYVKGVVSSIVENYHTSGNASFYISDDGTSNNQFFINKALYFQNKRYTIGPLLNKGDTVVICGHVEKKYNGTLETQDNKAYLYTLNNKIDGPISKIENEGACLIGTWNGKMVYTYPISGNISKVQFDAEMTFKTNSNTVYTEGEGTEIDRVGDQTKTLTFTWNIDSYGNIYVRYSNTGKTFKMDVESTTKGFYLDQNNFNGYMVAKQNVEEIEFNFTRSNKTERVRSKSKVMFGSSKIP